MPDPAIQAFFSERREAWRKSNIKANMSPEQIADKEDECSQRFAPDHWLPDAARRAGQISISTHPCTFSHPSARKNKNGYVTPVIARSDRSADGLLRTGNVVVEDDALGNAATLDVHKFLTLTMTDGQTLLSHIEQESLLAQSLLDIQSESYDELREGFLAMSRSVDGNVTSSKIKQVYFPVDEGYHLLSILTHSGMVFELRRRLDELRFSDRVKELRDKKRQGLFSEEGFSDLHDLTTIGYGGTKPQNISVLNNRNGGKAHLLLSVPPRLFEREVRLPRNDFFQESIYYREGRETFQKLHRLFKSSGKSVIPRSHLLAGRDNLIHELLDRIIDRMWAVRAEAQAAVDRGHAPGEEWPEYQKVWLLSSHEHQRETEDAWLGSLFKDIAAWMVKGYQKSVRKPVHLAYEEERFIHSLAQEREEDFR